MEATLSRTRRKPLSAPTVTSGVCLVQMVEDTAVGGFLWVFGEVLVMAEVTFVSWL